MVVRSIRLSLILILSLCCANIALARKPPVPKISEVNTGYRSLTVKWPDFYGTTGYNLYWSRDPNISIDGNYEGKKENALMPYTLNRIENGVIYYFILQSKNNDRLSKGSPIAAGIAQKPCPKASEIRKGVDELFEEYTQLSQQEEDVKLMAVKMQIIHLSSQMRNEQKICDDSIKD